MVDLKEQLCSVGEDQGRKTSTRSQPCEKIMKFCTDCHTTTTPLWRGGPAGPKSLCNACGIKFHKKRRALLALQKGGAEKPRKKKSKNITNGHSDDSGSSSNNSNNSNDNTSNNNGNQKGIYCDNNGTEQEEVGMGNSLSMSTSSKAFALGEDTLLKKLNGSWKMKKKLLLMGDLGEEEQAAILLMALSYGSIYA